MHFCFERQSMNNSAIYPSSQHYGTLRRKIAFVIWSLRFLACTYMIWVLWGITNPLRGGGDFLTRLGNFWQRDLVTGAAWQTWCAVMISILLWLILLFAMVCWWRASGHLLRDMALNQKISNLFRGGAWAGLTCASLSILLRPLESYFYTLHLPSQMQLWLWRVTPHDLLGILACGVLLMMSYLIAWMSEIAEENKAFV
jgi:hypothetical protein